MGEIVSQNRAVRKSESQKIRIAEDDERAEKQ
jgi:hypothetical protein